MDQNLGFSAQIYCDLLQNAKLSIYLKTDIVTILAFYAMLYFSVKAIY